MYRKAAQLAYNYRDSKNRKNYASTARARYGAEVWALALRLLAKIEEVEAELPNRCRAAVEAEAVRRLEGSPQ